MSKSTSNMHCADERRRDEVRKQPLNGLDYLEVGEDCRTLTVFFLGKAPEYLAKANVRITGGQRIRDIKVVEIDITRRDNPDRDDCMVVTVDRPGDSSTYRLCVVALDAQNRPTDRPLAGFDRRYACLDFTFAAGCPSDLDCAPHSGCRPEPKPSPDINYLAKDYASFRQLVLDRLATIVPDWRERHVPDLGLTLVEVLAYVGDYLSYYQDAVATEAYLDTARLRTSVRRHVRLMDYLLHEGCNARAWLALTCTQESLPLAAGTFYFITRPGLAAGPMHLEEELTFDSPPSFLVFEPLAVAESTVLRSNRNEIAFYTWGDAECCLVKGATSATLRDPAPGPSPEYPGPGYQPAPPPYDKGAPSQHPPAGPSQPTQPSAPAHALQLAAGDLLIFEEVKGPKTGDPADADPTHRHAVRLTGAVPDIDPLFNILIWHVEWAPEDALPFRLCISSIGLAPACDPIADVSVVRGNVLLVDHGRRYEDDLGQVPTTIVYPDCGDACVPREPKEIPGPYAPTLRYPDLTFSEPIALRLPDLCGGDRITPAFVLIRQDPRKAVPAITLSGIPATPDGDPAFTPADLADPSRLARALAPDTVSAGMRWLRGQLPWQTLERLDEWLAGPAKLLPTVLHDALVQGLRALVQTWVPRRDLLASGPDDRHFVVELDDERRSRIRFGDGVTGRRPDAGTAFRAAYRVGNGPTGNVGTEAIERIVFRTGLPSGTEIRVRNPLAARGGVAPESIAQAKLLAPYACRRTQERAVTAADYASIVMRDFGAQVQRAAATLRWTGAFPEVFVAIDPLAAVPLDEKLLCSITNHLERYRRIGHEVHVAWAHAIALDIALTVCVLPPYVRGHVKATLLEALGTGYLRDGRRGLFHPDALSFGDGIYLSQIVATAQAVAGVESVCVDKLERLYEGPNGEIESGVLPLGPLEIARLDNDPSFPERGLLTLNMRGGR